MAFVLFFVLFGLTFLNLFPDGYEWDYQSFGVAASGALILIVNLQVLVMTKMGVGPEGGGGAGEVGREEEGSA